MEKRGQVSFEYVVIVGFVTFVIIPLIIRAPSGKYMDAVYNGLVVQLLSAGIFFIAIAVIWSARTLMALS